jgi:hypothetical protein
MRDGCHTGVIWNLGAASPAPGPFSFVPFLVCADIIQLGDFMAPFRYAALPANIFRLVALSFSGMSPAAPSVAWHASALRNVTFCHDRRHHDGQTASAANGYMVNGCKKICEAAEKAGLARESLSRALSTPHVAEYLRLQTVRRLGIAAARAGHTMVELLDSDSEIVRDRASSFVLGLADIAPAATPSVYLNIEVKAGYVIDLSDDPRPAAAMRVVSRVTRPAIEHDAMEAE